MAKRVKGADALRKNIAAVSRAMVDAAREEINDIAEEVLDQSRDRAPQLSGEMIRTSEVKSRETKTTISRRVVYNEEYAPLQHDYAYTPGPVTRAKLGNRWGIGRGFLRTPTLLMKPHIAPRIAKRARDAIRRVLR